MSQSYPSINSWMSSDTNKSAIRDTKDMEFNCHLTKNVYCRAICCIDVEIDEMETSSRHEATGY